MTTTQARDARKNKANPAIRVPAELKDRIEGLRDELQASYEAGRHTLKADVNPEALPLWYVLSIALDELEDHKARSRKSSGTTTTSGN